MNDLIDRLARLDTTATDPADHEVAADLSRGHAALGRRRRTRAAVAGAGLTLGVGAVFGVVAVVGHDDAVPPAAAPRHADRSHGAGLQLVDYAGAQPVGFELAKVPQGYVVQGSDSFVLTLAKPGDDSHYLAFDHKVVVMLQSKDAAQKLGSGTDVTVGGEPGVIEGSAGETRNLRYFDGPNLVDIQVWQDIDLTDDQLVELAEAITVTHDVEAGVG
ncbi:hypothetical protein [Nocardioides sp. MH1]|uniref:hypothetical protein n=1 Tax=Nocardioides sp. MH1 TaxID=3242490 RepID=UPI00352025B2